MVRRAINCSFFFGLAVALATVLPVYASAALFRIHAAPAW
jgi:energy-converting hydrogenase Eha subunit H